MNAAAAAAAPGLALPRARRRGTHLGPLGGFTPFDRIELDIFALIIWQRRRSFRARTQIIIIYTHTQIRTRFVYTVHIYITTVQNHDGDEKIK